MRFFWRRVYLPNNYCNNYEFFTIHNTKAITILSNNTWITFTKIIYLIMELFKYWIFIAAIGFIKSEMHYHWYYKHLYIFKNVVVTVSGLLTTHILLSTSPLNNEKYMPNFNWDKFTFNYLKTFHKTWFFPLQKDISTRWFTWNLIF